MGADDRQKWGGARGDYIRTTLADVIEPGCRLRILIATRNALLIYASYASLII